jgi:hypothetical protein
MRDTITPNTSIEVQDDRTAHERRSASRDDPLLAACDSDEARGGRGGPGDVEAWALGAEPALHIGVSSGEEAYQLYDVRDALRLPDGRVVIVNQGTREVRVYSPEGDFLIASGEDGEGPGQWRLIETVRAADGDSLLVVDHRLGRYGWVDGGTGAYLGTADSARAEQLLPKTWHHRGLFLQAPPQVSGAGIFGPVVEALRIEDAAAPTFVEVDGEGRVWVRGAPSAPSAGVLRIYDLDGRLRATLTLPADFQAMSIREGEVLGVWRDSLDVEYVRAYDIEGWSTWAGPSIEEATRGGPGLPDAPDATPASLMEGFRALATSQEIHYAMNGTYTTDVDRLGEVREIDLPDGARVDILGAGPTGWRARLIDTTTGAGCTLSYGTFGPVGGLVPGTPACWDAPSE